MCSSDLRSVGAARKPQQLRTPNNSLSCSIRPPSYTDWRAGIVIASTPTSTHAIPSQADAVSVSPRASAAISVTINPINDLPTCNPVTINSNEDTAGSATLSCSDVEGGAITYSIQVPPANGTATVTNKGVVTFTPSADWNGTGTVFVAVSDGTGAASIAVAVSIAAVNDAPRCTATTIATDEDTVGTVAGPCVDIEGTPLTWTFSTPTKGSVSVLNGTIVYTPRLDANGSDSFTATASDGSLSATVTITVTIAPVNDAPRCSTYTLSGTEDGAVGTTVACVDPEGDRINYAIGTQPSRGSVALNANTGVLTYTPEADWNGSLTFTVSASDGFATGSAAITVNLTPVNDAPRCGTTTVTVNEDTAGTTTVNCSDVDTGDSLTFSLTSGSANGTTVLTPGSGAVSFTPAPNYNGSTSLSIAVTDGKLTTNTTVAITVLSINDAPTCLTIAGLSGPEDTAATVTLSCTDVENDPLTYLVTTTPANGSASFSGATLRFVPNADWNGARSEEHTV